MVPLYDDPSPDGAPTLLAAIEWERGVTLRTKASPACLHLIPWAGIRLVPCVTAFCLSSFSVPDEPEDRRSQKRLGSFQDSISFVA
jgi:hypothetical protein